MLEITIIDQVTLEEFTFYNVGEKSILRQFEGFEYADVVNSIDLVAGERSAVYVNSKFGKRSLSIIGDLVGSDVFATRRELLAVLRQTGRPKLVKITTYDNLELQFEAEVVKFSAPYNHQVHSFLIEMVAPDWRFYSQTLHTQEIARNTSEVVENAGNEATCPIFRINGPITTAAITNLNNTQEMAITHTLLEGEYIDIDCANQTVTDNEGTEVYSSLDNTPDFISLDPGENTIQFADSGGGATTNLEVIFRDSYNGV